MRITRVIQCTLAFATAAFGYAQSAEAATNCGSPGANQAIIWQNYDYTGNCDVLEIGSYSYSAIISTSVGNDSISSVSVGSNVKVTLYEHNLPGTSPVGDWLPIIATRTVYPDFNDKASSLRVESRTNCSAPGSGQAVVWSDINFAGNCDVLDWEYPVTYEKILGLSVGNDTISSFKTHGGFGLTLYQDAGFSGTSFSGGDEDLDVSVSSLGTFNDLTSSMRVGIAVN